MLRLVIAIAGATLAPAEVDKDGVRIRVHVRASVYTYEVANLSASPITSFEVQQCNAYEFKVPDGWQSEELGTSFRSWVEDERAAIGAEQTQIFTLRVSSKGAVLGQVEVRVGLASGDSVVATDVWGTVAEPRSTRLLVTFTVVAVFVAHTLILARRDRRVTRCATGVA